MLGRLGRRSLLAAVVVAAGAVGGGAGCSGCDGTDLSADAAAVAADGGSTTLRVRLTNGDDPVAGAPIAFFVIGTGPNDWTGQSVGGADTDADGVATLTIDGSLAGQVPDDHQVTGYRAEFRTTGDTDYCKSSVESTT